MRALTIIFCLTVGLVMTLPTAARASFLVQNPSFESPAEGSGNFAAVVPTNWSATDPGNNVRVIDKNFNSGNTVPGNVTGNQAVIIGVDTVGTNQGTDLYQSIGTSAGLTSLTLTVDAAHRVDSFVLVDSFTLGIWQDTDANGIPDSPLATVVVPAASLTASFQPFSVTALSVPAGSIYIRFTAADSGTTSIEQALLDNVSLVEGPAPEPASMGLLLLGGAALLGRRRKV